MRPPPLRCPALIDTYRIIDPNRCDCDSSPPPERSSACTPVHPHISRRLTPDQRLLPPTRNPHEPVQYQRNQRSTRIIPITNDTELTSRISRPNSVSTPRVWAIFNCTRATSAFGRIFWYKLHPSRTEKRCKHVCAVDFWD